MVHRRELEGEEILLGNQGDLYLRAMTWWDHSTGSVWSQPLGEAILGDLKGERLELLASSLAEWGNWKKAHPATLALDASGGPSGFFLEDMLLVVEFGRQVLGYPVTDVRHEGGVVNDVVGGAPIAVFADPDAGRWQVFSRVLDDREVSLGYRDGKLIDSAGGGAWDAATGLYLEGPLQDQDLDILPAFTEFPSDFRSHFPRGRIWVP